MKTAWGSKHVFIHAALGEDAAVKGPRERRGAGSRGGKVERGGGGQRGRRERQQGMGWRKGGKDWKGGE